MCVYVCTYEYMYGCTDVCMYVCMYICVLHACIVTYISEICFRGVISKGQKFLLPGNR